MRKGVTVPVPLQLLLFIPMKAINYRKPTTNAFPHEIMLVGLIVAMQDLGFMIYKIICCCGILLHLLGQRTLKRTRSIPESIKDGKNIFQD